MKNPRLPLSLAAVLLLLSQAPAMNAQEMPVPAGRTISVSGNAEKSLPADRVGISVQVRTVRDELAEAQAASKEVFSSLVEKLGELGITPEKIELRDHELGKEYRNGRDGERLHAGFYSSREFMIELDDASLLEATHTELAQNADVQVNHTSFTRKDGIEVRKELRKDALKAAREKAIAMAEVYGQEVGKPLMISEGGGFPAGPAAFNMRNTFASDPAGDTRGRVSLSVQVQVVFELLD